MNPKTLALLRCPKTGSALKLSADGHFLEGDVWRYPLENEIALLLPEYASPLLSKDEKNDE